MCNGEKCTNTLSSPKKRKAKHLMNFHLLEGSFPDTDFPEVLLKTNYFSG